jgi:hypothetical protein
VLRGCVLAKICAGRVLPVSRSTIMAPCRRRARHLNDTSWLRPTAHIWTRSKQPWLPLPEGDRNFETQRQGDPWWASVAPTG